MEVITYHYSVEKRVIAIQERAVYCRAALALPKGFEYCTPKIQHRLLDKAEYELYHSIKNYERYLELF